MNSQNIEYPEIYMNQTSSGIPTEHMGKLFSRRDDFTEIILFNVLDEIFANYYGAPPGELVKQVYEYIDRAMGLSIKPREMIMLMKHMPSEGVIEYYNELRRHMGLHDTQISKENFIILSDIQAIVDKILERYDTLKNFKLTSFLNEKTATKLIHALKNRGAQIYGENYKSTKGVARANDKYELRYNFSEFMVKGKAISINNENFYQNLRNAFEEYNKGHGIMIRLPRSVSGVGSEKIGSKKELDEFLNNIQIETGESDLNDKLIIESALPSNSFSSPSAQVYVHENGEVEVFAFTDQIISNGKEHEGNVILNPNTNPELTEKMKEVTKSICTYYTSYNNRENSVVGYAGVDFLLAKKEDIDNINDIINSHEYTEFEINGETYYLIVCEVNRRMTGAYGSSLIYNLFPSFQEYYIGNNNTFCYKYDENEDFEIVQDQIINRLRHAGLLFQPRERSEQPFGVYPYAIHPGKIQLVFVARDEDHFKDLRDQLEDNIGDLTKN